jgi:hypothetical protein
VTNLERIEYVLTGAKLWARRCAEHRNHNAPCVNEWLAWKDQSQEDEIRAAKALAALANHFVTGGIVV